MKKNCIFVGMLAILVFGMVLVGCGDDTPTPPFTGETLNGTTWEGTGTDDIKEDGRTVTIKSTLKFTSETSGDIAMGVTKFDGTWTVTEQDAVNAMFTGLSGPFTYTYDGTTGTITRPAFIGTPEPENFTVNAPERKLIIEADDEGDDPETYSLK
jgi:hypothetical protein